MIYKKKLTKNEVLEAIAIMMSESLPHTMKGYLDLSFDDDNGIEITITEEVPQNLLS